MPDNRLYVVKFGGNNEATYKLYKDNPLKLEHMNTDSSHKSTHLEGIAI